jgi:hypothetical protein
MEWSGLGFQTKFIISVVFAFLGEFPDRADLERLPKENNSNVFEIAIGIGWC